MSGARREGRQSRAVYRRRRLVFFGGLFLLVAAIGIGVWLMIAQPWADASSGPAPTSSATPTAETPPESPEPSPSSSPDPETEAAPQPCKGANITVEAVTDADTYAAGVMPLLSISLTNTGSASCTLDVGSATQVFTVSSGDDVWWRSTDCQENPSSMIVTLESGQNVTSATPVLWDRTRSDVSTCAEENRQRAPGGGASYHVAVSIGGFASATTTQILLY